MSEGEDNTAVTPDTGGGEEIVITDQDLYDHAMSDDSAPSEPAEQSAQAESAPEETQQGRDEKGRFAPKTQAQPEQTKPAQAAPQPQQEPKAPQAPQAQPQPKAEDHRVPLRELLEVRDRAQKAEFEVTQLKQAFEYLQRNGFQGVPAQGQPQQGPQQLNPQQLFEQPEQYLRGFLEPYVRAVEHQRIKDKTDASRDYAIDKFGEKAVNDAFEAMKSVRFTPDGDVAFNQIMASPLPYKSLVEWHKKHRAYQALGSDPEAWLRQRQQDWVNDPAARRAVIEAIRREQQSAPKAQPPNVSLPPSLSSIPAASSRVEDSGDMSDASLFRHAMK